MAALSPRSVNIQIKAPSNKAKAIADDAAIRAERALKDKEHAPPPPDWVIQPPMRPGGISEKFRSGKYLGKGGFAICYEGTLGVKKYAMKIVKAKMHQRKTEEKFRTELQIHAKLRHPCIVEFNRAFLFEESIYVILELCPNGSIMDMIKHRKCFSLPEVRRFSVQICGAVKYLHSRNVIHRDLKMGNLFLDKNMDIKLGDFGLAAILITEEEYEGTYHAALSRRRTMCGTPNYIAPEILEKRKSGHDHKVDIWSIGVILFAMLTGYPPFQSTTQDEIYRRVKSVEYKWPKDKECMNDIPDEAKDLVACLLRVNAEERPDLDRVVGHPFFSMHGGNAIPLVLANGCRTSKPPWLEAKSPRGDVMKKDSQLLALATLAKNCGVGHLDGFDEAFEVVGGKIDLSLYKECLEEEIARTYPIVPLPTDMVYTGKPDGIGSWAKQASTLRSYIPAVSKQKSPKSSSLPATEVDELQMVLPETRLRRTVPSHASTLRAPPYTTLRSRAITKTTAPPVLTLSQAAAPSKVPPKSTYPNRPNRGLLNELPVRSASNPTKAVATEPRAKPTGRITRSQSANIIPVSSAPSSKDSISTADQPESISPDPDDAKQPRVAPRKSRVVTRRNESQRLAAEKSPKRSAQPLGRRVATKNTNKRLLLSPDEVAECIPETKPKDVARNLRKIRAELDSAINGDCSVASEIDHSVRDQKKSLNGRLLITKWVDYTNKFGIGYILANGTVGCLFKADSSAPQSCVVVAGAEAHLRKKKCAAYVERSQIVPQTGAPVEFLEDCAADGMKRVLVQAATYLVKDGTTGLEERKIPGETMYDYEKRKRLHIWDKFAKYMTQNLGKDVTAQLNEEPNLNNPNTHKYTIAGPFVKFYQRLGNVGIWGFGDGSFQFNFPDHTKLIISGDGSWLDFYHLPIQAAHLLKQGAPPLSADTLATRGCLSYPPAVMARGIYQNEDFRKIIEANDLIVKLDFVKRVVGAWLDAGGLGGLGEEDRFLKWEGASEGGDFRFVWVSVGAVGGDERYELD